MLSDWLKRFFSKQEKTHPIQCRSEEHIYLETEQIRIEASLRSEIKELWRVFNDQQLKTLKLEKARSMKFPSPEQERPKTLLEQYRERRR